MYSDNDDRGRDGGTQVVQVRLDTAGNGTFVDLPENSVKKNGNANSPNTDEVDSQFSAYSD
jgi:hypothetical protein